MATATASIPQQMPHMPIPHVPRVRPPRILKGTPSPNSVPQPRRPIPSGKVWAQGRWRDPASKSAKASRRHQSRQVEKALRHDTHGQNIYVYANIRTHQVVYSLTRVMRNSKILPQLIYHGKKTVPAALRRDHWTPYFSLHFPPNEYGASSGLLAYHRLRALSKQRQLAPPEDMIITTQEDIDRIKARYDPTEIEDMITDKALKLPKVGQLLPKELRAKKLMNQKATSVADVAFVLGLQAEGPDPEEAARLNEARRKEWWNNISKRAKTRARRRAKLREGTEEQLEKRRQLAMKANGASLGLNRDAAIRIAMEYQGAVVGQEDEVDAMRRSFAVEEEQLTATDGHGQGERAILKTEANGTEAAEMEAVESTNVESLAAVRGVAMRPTDPKEVRVLWADLRDAAYAEQWPETVVHAELERMAVAKRKGAALKGGEHKLLHKSRSVHVIGGQKGSGWYLDPDEVEELERKRKEKAAELASEAEAGEEAGVEGSEGAQDAAAAEGSEAQKDDTERKGHKSRKGTAEALREKGIEVEMPRRSLWARAKGLFGR